MGLYVNALGMCIVMSAVGLLIVLILLVPWFVWRIHLSNKRIEKEVASVGKLLTYWLESLPKTNEGVSLIPVVIAKRKQERT